MLSIGPKREFPARSAVERSPPQIKLRTTVVINLGVQTFVNGTPMSPVPIDTTEVVTDHRAYCPR
jgi:hypothetical protein